MAREGKRLDHSLGVGPKGSKPMHALSHNATDRPQHLPNQELVKSSDEMKTPEYRGHMSRIRNRKK
jgi:hypothetical protein